MATVKPLPDWLGQQAVRHPTAPCIRWHKETYSFQAVSSLVSRLCLDLHTSSSYTLTLQPQVGVVSRDPFLTVLIVLACARTGWPVTVLNPDLPSSHLWQQIDRSSVSLLLASPDCHAAVQEPPTPRVTVHCVALPPQTNERAQSELRHLPPFPVVDLQRLQGHVFTSGSTGQPKALPFTFGHFYWSAVTSAYRLGYTPTDCWLHCLPLYHIGGLALLFRAVLFGFCLDLQAGFDTAAVLEDIQANRLTLASLVPTMLVRLLNAGLQFRDSPTAFRFALMGGAKVPRELRVECQDRRIALVCSYGLTESCSHITTTFPGQMATTGEGLPLLHAFVTIRDEAGHVRSPQTAGHICLQGPQICHDAYTAAAWHETGDIGYLDELGALHVLARQDEVYVSGGENVYAPEVAAVLERHPALQGAWVTGVADREWGHRIVALVECHPGVHTTAATLKAYCRLFLPAYKIPKHFLFVDALPRTGSGKVRQADARAMVTALWP